MARAQRDDKVHIVVHVWMGNHLHILFVSKDSMQATRFYGETMKKITDSMKALLGMEQLNLWEDRPSVAAILDLRSAINRIAYFFCNPANANLVDSIEEYPGLSSWEAFKKNLSTSVDATHTTKAPWIRMPTFEPLSSTQLTDRQDSFIAQKLISASKKVHQLVVRPNLWLRCFGITDPADVARANRLIFKRVERGHEKARELREREGKTVIGPEKLRQVRILAPHTPKRSADDRRIYFIASDRSLARQFIEQFRLFCEKCRQAYDRLCRGEQVVEWPPGAIPAAAPPRCNWF
jgi:hypothetical protein